jgi:Arc/MetJ family transcription regulator
MEHSKVGSPSISAVVLLSDLITTFSIIFYLDNFFLCIYYKNHTHLFSGGFMRTNIVIDDELMKEAMTLSQLKTKKAVVETGLKLLVQIKKQERIKRLRGKLKWDGDLDAMRLDK